MGLREDSLCLTKAAKLYEMCTRIVGSGAFDSFGTEHLLKAVALNNLAQLQIDLADFEEAKNCLADLASIVGSTDLTEALSNDEYDGIVANVLLLRPPTVAPAA